ncbi:MAG: hypothetical protein R3B06_20710 [Kofleriaceae bacterium]
MFRVGALLGLVVATGCQGFVGIDDVAGHLPLVDGEYLIGLRRTRESGAVETIRLRGTATLDRGARTLSLSLSQLAFDDGRPLSENAIGGITFPIDEASAPFDLSIAIRPEAVDQTTAPSPADATVTGQMVMRLEGDYALCAPLVSGDTSTSIGSIVVDHATPTPPDTSFDTDCDF